MEHDLVIVGGGPAGMTAAIYGARGGWNTILLDPMGGGGQVSTIDQIYNYPGFPEGISGFELMDLMQKQASRYGTEVVYDEALKIRKEESSFVIEGQETEYRAKAVIYAAGSAPKTLGVPGEEDFLGRGVSFCATCDGPLFKDKIIAVVGGGDSALSEAAFLAKFGKKVLLIHRRDEFRASMATINMVRHNPKIEMLLGKVVKEMKGEGLLKSLILEDVEDKSISEIQVDALFLYVGLVPRTSPAEGLVDLGAGGFILTNDDMSTKTEGIFVAGDVRVTPLRQVVTAVADGALAAWSAEKYLLECGK